MNDPMDMLREIIEGKTAESSSLLSAQALRRQCQEEGHRYQVHGKANPTKVACKRCHVIWAIGPRTEPTT